MTDKLREEIARMFWRMACAETEKDYKRQGWPLPEKWADPWHPSGTGVLQQRGFYENADAVMPFITRARADALEEAAAKIFEIGPMLTSAEHPVWFKLGVMVKRMAEKPSPPEHAAAIRALK